MAAALSCLEFEDRLDGLGASAFDAARRRTFGIDLETRRRATGGKNGKLLYDRIGAVEGLQVPAQRQRVAPIAFRMKEETKCAAIGTSERAFEFRQPIFH